MVGPQRMRTDEPDLYLFPGVLLAVVDVRSSVDSCTWLWRRWPWRFLAYESVLEVRHQSIMTYHKHLPKTQLILVVVVQHVARHLGQKNCDDVTSESRGKRRIENLRHDHVIRRVWTRPGASLNFQRRCLLLSLDPQDGTQYSKQQVRNSDASLCINQGGRIAPLNILSFL